MEKCIIKSYIRGNKLIFSLLRDHKMKLCQNLKILSRFSFGILFSIQIGSGHQDNSLATHIKNDLFPLSVIYHR